MTDFGNTDAAAKALGIDFKDDDASAVFRLKYTAPRFELSNRFWVGLGWVGLYKQKPPGT